MNLFWK